MAVTALSKQVEGQQWIVRSKDNNDISGDKCIKQEQGTLILSDMPERSYRRLTLSGGIAGKALFKQVTSIFKAFNNPSSAEAIKIGMNYAGDPLCHFDFSDEDLRSGRKYIEYQIIIDKDNDAMYFGLYGRDYQSKKGRRYVFTNPDDIYAFAMELGIKEAVIRNAAGKKLNTVSIEHLETTVSNLGTLLIIYSAAQAPDFKA